MHTTMTTKTAGSAIHLSILDQTPVSEGRFGCDYAWNVDYTSYRCLPHAYMPGSDESWAANEAGYYDDQDDCHEEAPAVTESTVTLLVVDARNEDEIWF